MFDWYMRICALLDSMASKAEDAHHRLRYDELDLAKQSKKYLEMDFEQFKQVWAEQLAVEAIDVALARHISFGEPVDYVNILGTDLRRVGEIARRHMVHMSQKVQPAQGFEKLLHPKIVRHALPLYRDGHLRDAVLASITVIFDLIRERTKIDADGAKLVGEVFALENPKLIFSEIQTESGKSDQKGFIQILQGAFQGIRNPKAHSLMHDLDEAKAAEYLVFASLLVRRVDEAIVPPGS
jgi:uncharacterized protein (TIGR02391 family)